MTTPPLGLGSIRKEELELPVVSCLGGGACVARGAGVGASVALKTCSSGMVSLSSWDEVKGRSKRAVVFFIFMVVMVRFFVGIVLGEGGIGYVVFSKAV